MAGEPARTGVRRFSPSDPSVPSADFPHMSIDNHSRPYLRQGVRLQWDELRQKHFLLMPEGALVLNSTAAAVLQLCDGKRTVNAIAMELANRYRGENVENDVRNLLLRMSDRGLLVFDLDV
jgi:coenzyme PQQ biosynthesis protein PqqD